MNQLAAVAYGGLAVVAASVALGPDRNAPPPDAGYMSGGGATPDGLGVLAWAPVEPPYNSDGDRAPSSLPGVATIAISWEQP